MMEMVRLSHQIEMQHSPTMAKGSWGQAMGFALFLGLTTNTMNIKTQINFILSFHDLENFYYCVINKT